MPGRICYLFACGLTLATLTQTQLYAQWYGGGDACNPCVQQVAMQPVVQTCYQTVPVTEYQQVKETAQRPVTETVWRDETYTAYRPVTEQRTVEVPTVSYQNVTECQTVSRDLSYWRNRVEPVCKATPCEYDGRPNMLGWLNRTGYSVRNSFTPNNKIVREYVPNVVAQQVPVTRQVAIQGTRQVTQNYTTMQAYQATRKVAEQQVRYETVEVIRNVPRTVYRTVPSGTSVAYVPAGSVMGGTATAFAPTPVDPFAPRSAESTNGTNRTAEKPDTTIRSRTDDRQSLRTPTPRRANEPTPIRSRNLNAGVPEEEELAQTSVEPTPVATASSKRSFKPVPKGTNLHRTPSMVRVGRWVPSRKNTENVDAPALSDLKDTVAAKE
ncbi:hypothetical protein Pla110_05260 [Polystyrenella longa]|uniref:Uncharacterized protein n=1 Tax=Polystyrenella longa TaxID=2528007 RepID=A0A518CHW9_9PLAN|nr:hypothetical protein [Polystyrenella longa]QDU78822.1 hypothetical protein Pla110_05260 [Polystyrenella longa]